MWRRLRCAVKGFAPVRRRWGRNYSGVSGAKGLQESLGKISWRMAFYLGEKISVSTNDLLCCKIMTEDWTPFPLAYSPDGHS